MADSAHDPTVKPADESALPPAVAWCARHGALCVGLAAAVVYLNALPNGFTYDDVPVILKNPATDPQAPLWEPWRQPWWALGEWAGDADRPYRPLTVQTFALERRLFGENPLPFHLVNLALHAAVSVGVWWLARRLGASAVGALAAGVLFAVHPIHTEAVANIVGRAELMSIGGMLLAVRLYDRRIRCAALAADPRGLKPAARWIFSWGGVLAASAVAIFSKERGVAVVAVLGAWHVWSHLELRRFTLAAQPPPRSSLWYSWLKPVIPALILVGVYLWLRAEISGTLFFAGQRYGPDNPLREADTIARVLTPFALLGRYLWLMIWPARLLCNYSVNVLQPTESVLDPLFVLGFSFIVVVVGAVVPTGIRRFARAPDKSGFHSARGSLSSSGDLPPAPCERAWTLLVFCFVATYLLASNSVLLLETMFAERWFYGPVIWVCCAVGLMFDRVAARLRSRGVRVRPAFATVCVGVVLAGLAVRSMLRNPEWASNEILFQTDLARMDRDRRSSHLCYLVGKRHLARGDLDQAEALFLEATAIFADYPDYQQALGRVYLAKNEFSEAAYWLEKAHFLERRNAETKALLEIAVSRRRGGDLLATLRAAREAARQHPDDIEPVRRWAELAEKVDLAEAAAAYRRLAGLAPNEPAAWNGLAYALGNTDRIGEAVQTYRRVLARWPDNWEAHGNLATLLMNSADPQQYQPECAIQHARRAVQLNPDSWQLQLNLAEVLANCGQEQEAADMFESFARRVGVDSREHKFYLERAAYLRTR